MIAPQQVAGEQSPARCAYVACTDPATATVPVGAGRRAVCFLHEREYADRYGPEDIYGLPRVTLPAMAVR